MTDDDGAPAERRVAGAGGADASNDAGSQPSGGAPAGRRSPRPSFLEEREETSEASPSNAHLATEPVHERDEPAAQRATHAPPQARQQSDSRLTAAAACLGELVPATIAVPLFWALFYSDGRRGFGDVVLPAIVAFGRRYLRAVVVLSVALLLLVVLVETILDVIESDGPQLPISRSRRRRMLGGLAFVVLVINVVAAGAFAPWLVMAAVLIVATIAPLAVASAPFRNQLSANDATAAADASTSASSIVRFASRQRAAFASLATTSVVVWAALNFASGNLPSTDRVRHDVLFRLNCSSTLDGMDATATLVPPCSDALLLWTAPLLLSAWYAVVALLHSILSAVASARLDPDPGRFERASSRASATAPLFVMSAWMAAGLATSQPAFASALLFISALVLVAALGAVRVVAGRDEVLRCLATNPMLARNARLARSDWTKALGVLVGAPLIVIALLLAALARVVVWCFVGDQRRRERNEPRTELECGAHEGPFTVAVAQHVNMLAKKAARDWDWTSVLCKTTAWALALVAMQVAGATTVDASQRLVQRLIETHRLTFAETCALFCATAWVLLMVPLTPGMPVYMASGVVITRAAMVALGEDAFWVGWIAATLVSLLAKLFSLAGGMALGRALGSCSVEARRAARVNALVMRALRRVLRGRGAWPTKTAVFVGGPDWLTAFVAGILGAPLLVGIVASLPVVAVIGLYALSGACMLRQSRDDPLVSWAALALAALVVGVAVQTALMMSAMHGVEVVAVSLVQERSASGGAAVDDAGEDAPDAEVQILDETAAERQAERRRAANWGTLPHWMRAVLATGTALAACSAYFFVLLGAGVLEDPTTAGMHGGMSAAGPNSSAQDLVQVRTAFWVGLAFALAGGLTLAAIGLWTSFVGLPRVRRERGDGVSSVQVRHRIPSRARVAPEHKADGDDDGQGGAEEEAAVVGRTDDEVARAQRC